MQGIFFPKKRLGQHFVVDEAALSREAELLGCEGCNVLEIGGGDGRLSKKILSHSPSSLSIVEIHAPFASILSRKFSGRKNVSIIRGDILHYLGTLPTPPFPFSHIIGNIPYQISGPLFSRLAQLKFERGVFCVQKEVAQRLCAAPGTSDWGRLSLAVSAAYSPSIAFSLPRTAFYPAPKVDSAVVAFMPNKEKLFLPPHFHSFSTALFSHKRKTVSNAIYDARAALALSKEEAKKFPLPQKFSKRKVFTLTPHEWVELALHFYKAVEK